MLSAISCWFTRKQTAWTFLHGFWAISGNSIIHTSARLKIPLKCARQDLSNELQTIAHFVGGHRGGDSLTSRQRPYWQNAARAHHKSSRAVSPTASLDEPNTYTIHLMRNKETYRHLNVKINIGQFHNERGGEGRWKSRGLQREMTTRRTTQLTVGL